MGCPIYREPAPTPATAPVDPCAHARSQIRRRRNLSRHLSSGISNTNTTANTNLANYSSNSAARAVRAARSTQHRSIERYLGHVAARRERERERVGSDGVQSWDRARQETDRLRERIQRIYAGGPTPGDIAQSYRDAYMGGEAAASGTLGRDTGVTAGSSSRTDGWETIPDRLSTFPPRGESQPRDFLRASFRLEDEPLARQLRLQMQQLRDMESAAPRSLRDFLGRQDTTRDEWQEFLQDDEPAEQTERDVDSPWPAASTNATLASTSNRTSARSLADRLRQHQDGVERQLSALRTSRLALGDGPLSSSLSTRAEGSIRSRWSDFFDWAYPCEFERDEEDEDMEEDDHWEGEISVGAP